MAITYTAESRCFYLSGGNVSYVIHIDGEGSLMNLYWGERVPDGSITPELSNYPGGASFDLPAYHQPWELPTRWGGWYGLPAVGAVNAAGDDMVVLKYVSHTIFPGKSPLKGFRPRMWKPTARRTASRSR